MPGKQFHTIIKNTSIDMYLLLLLYTSYSMFIVSIYFCHTIYRIFQNTQWLCYKLLIHRHFCFAFILILFLLPLCFLCLSLESWGFVLSSYLQHSSKKLFFLKRGTWFVKKCVYTSMCFCECVIYIRDSLL